MVRLNPDDAPPVFEALAAMLFDGVRLRHAFRLAMKDVHDARVRMAFEDCRGNISTYEYELSAATYQLLLRLPYVSEDQPLLGLTLLSSRVVWNRICSIAALHGLRMVDVCHEAIRRRGDKQHPSRLLRAAFANPRHQCAAGARASGAGLRALDSGVLRDGRASAGH
jgi:hypothetical protein